MSADKKDPALGGIERGVDTKTSGMGVPPSPKKTTGAYGGQYGTLLPLPPRLRILHPFVGLDRHTAAIALAGFNRWAERWNSVAPYPAVPDPVARFTPAPVSGLKLPKQTLLLVDYEHRRLLAFSLTKWKAWAVKDGHHWRQASLEQVIWAGALKGDQHE